MISYKRDVLERQSLSEVKMGRGSPICERVRKKIVEYFKNNVPQRQISKALQISYLQCGLYCLIWFESLLVFILFKFKNVPTFPEFGL